MTRGQARDDLVVSLQAVHNARARLDAARRGTEWEVTTLEQQEVLAALEDFAVALARHGRPLPHRMRNELTMYRAMLNHRRRPR